MYENLLHFCIIFIYLASIAIVVRLAGRLGVRKQSISRTGEVILSREVNDNGRWCWTRGSHTPGLVDVHYTRIEDGDVARVVEAVGVAADYEVADQ